jgi:hypothetical protein
LEFAAENLIRRGTSPANIVAVEKVILEAGARTNQSALDETLGLVSSDRVPRECGVQLPLIDLLCDFGASPDSVDSARGASVCPLRRPQTDLRMPVKRWTLPAGGPVLQSSRVQK